MSRHPALAPLAASLALALLLPAAPAQASEVVKLARLVITGKRLSAEPQQREPAPAARPQDEAPALPKVILEPQSVNGSQEQQAPQLRAAALPGRELMRGAM